MVDLGAGGERCRILIVMGKTDPDGRSPPPAVDGPGARWTRPGSRIVGDLEVYGYLDRESHSEVVFDNVRVPSSNIIASPGDGFMIAQARLGPGRIHHCMRAIGMAERALDMMIARAASRVAFGGPISDQGVVQAQIAESRLEIEQARLLVLKAAWLIDNVGTKGARTEISAIKVAAPRAALSRARPGDPDPWRRRGQPALPARLDVGARPHAAARRRPGRGAPAHRRPPGAGPRPREALSRVAICSKAHRPRTRGWGTAGGGSWRTDRDGVSTHSETPERPKAANTPL